jgi:hypothetical protein
VAELRHRSSPAPDLPIRDERGVRGDEDPFSSTSTGVGSRPDVSAHGAAGPPERPLGELLVAQGLLSQEQLALALGEQEQTGRPLDEILVAGGLVSAPDIAQALATQRGRTAKAESPFAPRLVPVPASPLRLAVSRPQEARVVAVPPQEGELGSLQRELASLREELESRRHAGAELESEVEHLRGQFESHRRQVGELESVRRELAAARAELESRRHAGAALESELERLRGQLASRPQRSDEIAVTTQGPYLVFATVEGAYVLIETAGALPAAGEAIEVHGTTHHVLRLGPSPLAGSALRCVYTIPAGSSPTGDSPGPERRETPSHGNQS